MWGRVSAILTVAAAGCLAQDQPPKQLEQALRARANEFYTLLLKKQYRAAEKMVAPESRDAYYAQEKPELKDFTLTSVKWEKGFQKADVNFTSEVAMRRAIVGQFDVRVPFSSHWVLEHGLWMWYIPKVTVRDTPFGKMRVDESTAKQSGLDIDAMIAKGPKAEELRNAIKVSASKVTIPAGVGNSATVTVENTLPGVVHIYTQVISTAGVVSELSKHDLGLGDKAELKIQRITAPSPKDSVVYLRVQPTGQSIPITVE